MEQGRQEVDHANGIIMEVIQLHDYNPTQTHLPIAAMLSFSKATGYTKESDTAGA